jgi:hypothetical protein
MFPWYNPYSQQSQHSPIDELQKAIDFYNGLKDTFETAAKAKALKEKEEELKKKEKKEEEGYKFTLLETAGLLLFGILFLGPPIAAGVYMEWTHLVVPLLK